MCPVGPMDHDASLRHSKFRFKSGAGYQSLGASSSGQDGALSLPRRGFDSPRARHEFVFEHWGVAQRQLHPALTRAFEGSSPSSPAKVCRVVFEHRMPKRSRRRIANPLLSGSSPDRCSMLEWWNLVDTLVSEPSAYGRESSNLSSSTKF